MRFLPILIVLLCVPCAVPMPAQVGFGTLLQSLDPVQASGVTAVGLQGNPSITTNEIVAWSQGEASGRARAIYNAQALGILFGDRNNDGLPFDWPDIDALDVAPPQLGFNQPGPYDIEFSFGADVQNQTGTVVVNTGDIVQLTGIGTYAVTIPRGAFQAALGTSAALNVGGFARTADGSVLVSFRGSGSGNNIVNPLSGQPGTNITWTATDVFIIRPPFGALPAILAYRQGDLAPIMTAYYAGYTLSEIKGLALQPASPTVPATTLLITNPYDPTGIYQAGRRPRILWTGNGDDNVFCTNNALNPLATTHNFYAIVGGTPSNTSSVAGYVTNGPTNRILADALALWPQAMTTNTRVTLDVNNLLPPGGSTLTVTVRSPEAAGTRFQVVLSAALLVGQGYPFSSESFRYLILNYADPIFQLSFNPAFFPFFTTGTADASGTASTIAIPVPTGAAGTRLWFQAYETTIPFELAAPLMIRIQ